MTNIELYEALKKDLSDDSARLIAEVVPMASDVATKTDIADLRTEIARLGETIGDRMLRYFVPLWIAVYGSLATMVGLLVFVIASKP